MLLRQPTSLGRSFLYGARADALPGRVMRFSTAPVARMTGKSPMQAEKQRQTTGVLPPYGPVGASAALAAKPGSQPKSTLFEHEFSLKGKVAMVSGGNRGLGLEMAMALAEAGARAVYCVDLPKNPSGEWTKVKEYLSRMQGRPADGSFEYISADVRNQEEMWKIGETIGNNEGRMDACVAAAGILRDHTDCLEYPARQFQDVLDVNVNGVLFTAQAAGRQMARFGNGGSIVLIASMSGSITNKDHAWISYNTSKSAVLQMTRSMACELGPRRIRVNSISPGYIYTHMTAAYLDPQPHLIDELSRSNPLGRLGRPDELRGVVTWLASDASTFCTGSDILVTGGHHAW
ncbi:sorbose reductase sou1 [Wolfiporia cocos MD-104 SS10]|uniref:Sorbose reductase sou1 n=1 Tax=Wolfiporia cocos (strain MD-104) TaxID=742152 RepID=A0A2H3JEX9_WOLCO|nr:sorbose reductase sou1 [Wolfiporia cocos MD-104 SS10]